MLSWIEAETLSQSIYKTFSILDHLRISKNKSHSILRIQYLAGFRKEKEIG